MLTIYRPVKSDWMTQAFGENKAFCRTGPDGKAIRPFQIVGAKECPAGYVPFYREIGLLGHNGTDWSIYRGEPIYFNVESDYPTRWFAKTEVDADGGVGLRVFSTDALPFGIIPRPFTKNIQDQYVYNNSRLYVQFLFWHLKDVCLAGKPKIQVGTFSDGRPEMAYEIRFGDMIALGDSTGASSADHLHFAMKFCLLNTMTIGNDNGYAGAVDMSELFVNDFVGDMVAVEAKALTLIQMVQKFLKGI